MKHERMKKVAKMLSKQMDYNGKCIREMAEETGLGIGDLRQILDAEVPIDSDTAELLSYVFPEVEVHEWVS